MTNKDLFNQIFKFITENGKLTNQAKSCYGSTDYELNGVTSSYQDDGYTTKISTSNFGAAETGGVFSDDFDSSLEVESFLGQIWNCINSPDKTWGNDFMSDLDWLQCFVNNYPANDLVGTPAANKD